MNAHRPERRDCTGSQGNPGSTTAEIVRQGLAIQESSGTVSAIEFLKAKGIGSRVIQRVLSGTALRAEDESARADAKGIIQA